jgi:hypothetical protein
MGLVEQPQLAVVVLPPRVAGEQLQEAVAQREVGLLQVVGEPLQVAVAVGLLVEEPLRVVEVLLQVAVELLQVVEVPREVGQQLAVEEPLAVVLLQVAVGLLQVLGVQLQVAGVALLAGVQLQEVVEPRPLVEEVLQLQEVALQALA